MGAARALRLAVAGVLLPATVLMACTAVPEDSPPDSSRTSSATATPVPTQTALPTTSAPTPTVPPRTDLPAALLGTDWERIPTSDKVVALTFDAGANDSAVESVLATLAAEQVHGTFFMTGDFARTYPQRIGQIAAGGHRFGNHSNVHGAYPDLTNEQITADLAAAEQAIAASGGSPPRPFFRFPFGDRTAEVIQAVNDNGYGCIRWTVDTLGWQGTSGGITADIVRQRVLDAAQPGEIVLMHLGANPDDGTTLDAEALPGIIEALRAMGYAFVTLDAMLG